TRRKYLDSAPDAVPAWVDRVQRVGESHWRIESRDAEGELVFSSELGPDRRPLWAELGDTFAPWARGRWMYAYAEPDEPLSLVRVWREGAKGELAPGWRFELTPVDVGLVGVRFVPAVQEPLLLGVQSLWRTVGLDPGGAAQSRSRARGGRLVAGFRSAESIGLRASLFASTDGGGPHPEAERGRSVTQLSGTFSFDLGRDGNGVELGAGRIQATHDFVGQPDWRGHEAGPRSNFEAELHSVEERHASVGPWTVRSTWCLHLDGKPELSPYYRLHRRLVDGWR
ncbi:MAG: hypothetical protein AAFZ65_18665, partial [Planctomycetota bacterium]